MFTKNELTELIWTNCWKFCFLVEGHTWKLDWFFGTVWEFCWLVTLLNFTDKHVFIIVFLFNGKKQLHGVHCIGNGLQNSRCKIVESNVPLIFWNFKEIDSHLGSKCLVYDCIKVFRSGQILEFVPQLRCGRKCLQGIAYYEWLKKSFSRKHRDAIEPRAMGAIVPWTNDCYWFWPYH